MKREITKYTVLLIFALFVFLGLSVISRSFDNNSRYSSNVIFVVQFFIFCFLGIVFGFEKFISEIKKEGRWHINLPRLLIIGIPSLSIGIYVILYNTFLFIPPFLNLVFVNFILFINLMQMILGYTIITSFYKIEKGTSKT